MNENKRVAIYCRLSKDDEQSGDSVSIETQKMMLSKYCADQNFEIFDIYIDDGYSGLNFNRPSFKRLIKDLENGEFNIVITKDLSRLGRDYIQTGYYIDVYFVSKRIRYIAVNDGIDTLKENNDIAPFKNILNDMYAKDLSRKVKSAKQQRAQNGLYISAQPPYGYKVNPYNRNQLIIDPQPAQIIKLIFELAQFGNNYSEISRIIERKKIISPSTYKAMSGDTRFLKFATQDRLYKWSYQTIKAIISNPVYVGDMVNHKVETVNYKTKERVRVPIENQIIVHNTHEPIIDRKVFETVNERLSNRRKANHNYKNIFKKLAFCAECGEELQLISKKLKYEIKPMLRCVKHVKDTQKCTRNHFIYYEDLFNEVQKQLDIHIEEVINSEKYQDLCEAILKSIYARAQEDKKNKLQQKLQAINRSIKQRYKSLSSHSKIDELESLYNTQKDLMYKITNTINASNNLPNMDSQTLKNTIQKLLCDYHINENTIKLFIKRIEIGHLEKSPSKSHQKITFYYRF